MRNFSLIIVIHLILFSSCESTLNLDLDNKPSILVLNALAGNDSVVKANISQSRNLMDNSLPKALTGATVRFYEENKLIGNLQASGNGWYQLNSTFKSEKEYEIVVSHPDYPSIHSKTYIPTVVPVIEFKLDKTDANRQYYRLKFNDRKGSEDYYMILLKGVYMYDNDDETVETTVDLRYFSDDVVFNGNLLENATDLERQYLLGSKTFSDTSFNGQQAEITFFSYRSDYWSKFSELKVELYHINKDYYYYERSKIMIENRKDLPFYKKIDLYSNVKSGSGVFAGYAVNTMTLKL